MKHKLRGCILILGIVALFSLGAWLLMPRPPLLLERARKVYKFDGESWGNREHPALRFQWMSDTTLLHSRLEGTQDERRVVYRYDVATRQDMRLPGLTASLDAMDRKFKSDRIDDQQVSPDGKWFVCSSRSDSAMLAEVDGKTHHFYSYDEYPRSYRRFFWLPDSRYWIEEARSEEEHIFRLRDVQHPESAREFFHLRSSANVANFLTQKRFVSIEGPEYLGNFVGADVPQIKQATICSQFIDSGQAEHFTFSFPTKNEISEFVLSPDGKYVAWIVDLQETDLVSETLNKYLRFIQPVTVRRSAIWMSDLKGHTHEIGRIEVPVDLEAESRVDTGFLTSPTKIEDLKWLPSGNALSFQHDGSLYTVPAQ